jgi:hypothetical protein
MFASFFRPLLFVLLGAAGAMPAQGALDLSGKLEEYVGEGNIIYRRLVLTDDKRVVEMQLPNGWSHRTGGPARLQLIPPGKGFAQAVVSVEPLPARAALDEEVAAALQQQMLTALPSDSQAVTLMQVNQGPIGPNAREGIEAVVSFKRIGYTFLQSSVVVNMADYRLVLQFTAPEAEFELLHSTFRRAIHSVN